MGAAPSSPPKAHSIGGTSTRHSPLPSGMTQTRSPCPQITGHVLGCLQQTRRSPEHALRMVSVLPLWSSHLQVRPFLIYGTWGPIRQNLFLQEVNSLLRQIREESVWLPVMEPDPSFTFCTVYKIATQAEGTPLGTVSPFLLGPPPDPPEPVTR